MSGTSAPGGPRNAKAELQAAGGVDLATAMVTCAGSAVAGLAARPACLVVGRAVFLRSASMWPPCSRGRMGSRGRQKRPAEAEMGGFLGSRYRLRRDSGGSQSLGLRAQARALGRDLVPFFQQQGFSTTRSSRVLAGAEGPRALTRDTTAIGHHVSPRTDAANARKRAKSQLFIPCSAQARWTALRVDEGGEATYVLLVEDGSLCHVKVLWLGVDDDQGMMYCFLHGVARRCSHDRDDPASGAVVLPPTRGGAIASTAQPPRGGAVDAVGRRSARRSLPPPTASAGRMQRLSAHRAEVCAARSEVLVLIAAGSCDIVPAEASVL